MTSFKTLGSLSIAATLAATAALAAPTLGNQDWTATIANSPAFCNIATPTVDAVLEYDTASGNLTLVSAGSVSFDVNGITAISAQTDGIVKVNGTPFTDAAVLGNGIQYSTWNTMTTDLGTISGTSSSPDRKVSWVLSGNEASASIAPGGTVQPPAGLSFRNGDVVTLSWTISCGS